MKYSKFLVFLIIEIVFSISGSHAAGYNAVTGSDSRQNPAHQTSSYDKASEMESTCINETWFKLEVVFAPQMLKLALKDEEKLIEFAKSLARKEIINITISASANERSSDEYRMGVAGKRAESLKTILLLYGVPYDKIKTQALTAPVWNIPHDCVPEKSTNIKGVKCVDPGSDASITANIKVQF